MSCPLANYKAWQRRRPRAQRSFGPTVHASQSSAAAAGYWIGLSGVKLIPTKFIKIVAFCARISN